MGNTQAIHQEDAESQQSSSREPPHYQSHASAGKPTTLTPIKRTENSRIVTVIVDEQIQFEVDVTDPNNEHTCGWLLSEVTRKYTIMLEVMQREEFHQHKAKMQARQPSGAAQKQDVRLPRQKRRYIVALKTKDFKEGIDSWLNQYERDLSVLKDGTVLIAHFAKLKINGTTVPSGLAQRRDISIDDFEQMRVIGRGGFSRVILARKKDTGRLYAIKILRKDRLINENQIKPILSERRVLEKLDHPFVIKLHWAFQSERELFFVMDICTGGELFFHLLQQRRFSEKLAKFYMCEILLGFQYMHERNIVYRDIKPENILVDMDGHIRVADFGLSKIIPEKSRSYSFCGSPEYLSPEMLQNGEGHDRRLDIYCLGVLLYEMLTGLPPFFDDDHQLMFEKIMYSDLILDQPFLSREVKDLLANMLEKEPINRFQSISEIMEHAWFDDIDWSQVTSKSMKPPLVPDINSCYFEQDNGEEGEEDNIGSSFYKPTSSGNLNKSTTHQRRQSYYIHSTVQLQSCIDDRTSFMRSPSQLRQFFDSSALMTNLNESILDKSLTMHKQASIRSNMSPETNIINMGGIADTFGNASDQAAAQEGLTDRDGPSVQQAQFFAEFDYAHPPLGEIQILRVLENHIKRKKRAQLDKARKFREQLLQIQQTSSRRTFREDNPAEQSSNQTSNQALFIGGVGGRNEARQDTNNLYNQSSSRFNPQEADDVIEEKGFVNRPLHLLHNHRQTDLVLPSTGANLVNELQNIVKEVSEPPMQIFSDSEIYEPSQSRKIRPLIRKRSSEVLIPEEHGDYERQVAERIGNYDDKPLQQKKRAQEQQAFVGNGVDEDDDGDESSMDDDSIGNETAGFHHSTKKTGKFNSIVGGGSSRQLKMVEEEKKSSVASVHQMPFQSSDTVSLKKLRYQNQTKKMHSGEYQYDIHNFESMREQANQSKRNIASGLSRGVVHQSLQEVFHDDQYFMGISEEHMQDSPILSNKLEYAQQVKQSHENLQMRNNMLNVHHHHHNSAQSNSSAAYQHSSMDMVSYGTGENKKTVSNMMYSQGGSDRHLRLQQSTGKTVSTAGNQAMLFSEQAQQQETQSPATVHVKKNKFNMSGSIEGAMTPMSNKDQHHLDAPTFNKFMLNGSNVDAPTESDLTIENFQGNVLTVGSLSKASYRHSMPKSPQKKKSNQTLQLNLKPVKEQPPSKKGVKREQQLPQVEVLTSQQQKKLDRQASNRQPNVVSPRASGGQQQKKSNNLVVSKHVPSHQKKSSFASQSKSSMQLRIGQQPKGSTAGNQAPPGGKPVSQLLSPTTNQQKVRTTSPKHSIQDKEVKKPSFGQTMKSPRATASSKMIMSDNLLQNHPPTSARYSASGHRHSQKQPKVTNLQPSQNQANVLPPSGYRDLSPKKQLKNSNQVLQKNLSPEIAAAVSNSLPQVSRLGESQQQSQKSSSSLDDDDEADNLVADENEESAPQFQQITIAPQKNKVRKSTTGIPSMHGANAPQPFHYEEYQGDDGGDFAVDDIDYDQFAKTNQDRDDGHFSLKQLLGGMELKSTSQSPNPIKRGGLQEMRGGEINDRLSPQFKMTSGRIQQKLSISPLKIASTQQLYKASDNPFNISPRRTTKLVSPHHAMLNSGKTNGDQLELQQMAHRSNNKRNNSITKMNKIGLSSSGRGFGALGGVSYIGNMNVSTNRAQQQQPSASKSGLYSSAFKPPVPQPSTTSASFSKAQKQSHQSGKMIGRKPSFGNLKIETNTKVVKKPNNLAQSSLSVAKSRAGIDYDQQSRSSKQNHAANPLKKRGKSSEKIQADSLMVTSTTPQNLGAGQNTAKKKGVQASMSSIQIEKDAVGLLKMPPPSGKTKNLRKTSSSKSLQACQQQKHMKQPTQHASNNSQMHAAALTIKKGHGRLEKKQDSSRNVNLIKTGGGSTHKRSHLAIMKSYDLPRHSASKTMVSVDKVAKKQAQHSGFDVNRGGAGMAEYRGASGGNRVEYQPPELETHQQLKIQLVAMQQKPLSNKQSRDKMVRDVAVHQHGNANANMRMVGYTHDFLDMPQSEAMDSHGEAVRGNPSPIRVSKLLSRGHIVDNSSSSNCRGQNQHKNGGRTSLSSLNVDDDDLTENDNSNSVSAPTASNQLGTMHDARRDSQLGLQVQGPKYNCLFDASKESSHKPIPYSYKNSQSRLLMQKKNVSQLQIQKDKPAEQKGQITPKSTSKQLLHQSRQ